MDQNYKEQNTQSNINKNTQELCSVCHQPILSQYYFCPNCGTKVHEEPLSTSIQTQIMIYAFSAVLPFLGFLFIKKWQGTKYYKSKDSKANIIGQIAWVILVISTILIIWLSYVWTQHAVQSALSSFNTDFSSL